jgi:hypothetical protein
MFGYDEVTRHQIATERIERIAGDYARSNTHSRRRRSRWDLLLTVGMRLVERTRRSAQRAPLRA